MSLAPVGDVLLIHSMYCMNSLSLLQAQCIENVGFFVRINGSLKRPCGRWVCLNVPILSLVVFLKRGAKNYMLNIFLGGITRCQSMKGLVPRDCLISAYRPLLATRSHGRTARPQRPFKPGSLGYPVS